MSNEFLTFGGTLLGDAQDEHAVLLSFTSRAPIVRWAGHSQGVDPYTDEIGAFFARLMVPIDFQPDAEARIAAADPEALYAAFLLYGVHRLRPGGRLREAYPSLAATVDHESHRLAAEVPEAWSAPAASSWTGWSSARRAVAGARADGRPTGPGNRESPGGTGALGRSRVAPT